MLRMTATEAQKNFGKLMDKANREEVCIQKHGRNHIVLLPYDRYEDIEYLEDQVLGEMLLEAKGKGNKKLSAKKSSELMKKWLKG